MKAPVQQAIPNEALLRLPRERDVISYRVGCDIKGQGTIVKWTLWNKKTEVSHLPPQIASYIRDCLRDFLSKKSIDDCRKAPTEQPAIRFEQNVPTLKDDDWDANPQGQQPRQAHSIQVHCFDDAVFLAFLIDPKETIYKMFRLDPRICHELADEIDRAELHFVEVRTARAPTTTIQ
jgi:hypothetical protein